MQYSIAVVFMKVILPANQYLAMLGHIFDYHN